MINLTLQDLTLLVKNTKDFAQLNKKIDKGRIKSTFVFLLSDMTALLISMLVAIAIRLYIYKDNLVFDEIYNSYYILVPSVTLLYLSFLYIKDFYPGFNIDKIEELRTLTYTSFTVFGIVGVFGFLMNNNIVDSRLVFIVSLLLTIFLVPTLRGMSRKIFSKYDWWGLPVILIGAGKQTEDLIYKLRQSPEIGFKPILVLDDDDNTWGYIHNVPVVGGIDILPQIKDKIEIDNALLSVSSNTLNQTNSQIVKYSKYFTNITIVTNTTDNVKFWLNNKDLGGLLGVEFKFNLMTRSARITKRIFDLVVTSSLIVALSPLLLLVSILIKLDSKGKVIYRQNRIGVNSFYFKIFKFRSMHINADKILDELLESNPLMKEEYLKYRKLTNDPRSTRIGKILRKFSLDELPQFFNVLKGEMSLIGPRAALIEEKEGYEGFEHIIFKVKPGISGLWQVSMSNPTIEERIVSNLYYIKNWSMFLDLYIFFRTILVIVTGKND